MLRSVKSLARNRVLVPVLALAMVAAGCRGADDAFKDQAAEARRANAVAKEFLAEGRYTDAKLQFEEVLEEVDGTNAEARFGAVLSELLQFVSIIRVVSQLTGDTAQADENEFLHALIDDLLTDLRNRFDDIAFELNRLKTDAAFSFTLENPTPVYLTSTDEPDLDLQGEWDRGEVFLLDAGIQAVLGVLNLAQAVDLRADYLDIFNSFTEADIDLDLGGDTDELIAGIESELPKIQNLLAMVLNTNGRLLDLDPGTGVEQWQQGGLHLANAVDSLRKGLFFASQDIEGDPDQSDDVIGFEGEEPIDPDTDLCAIRDRDDEDELAEYTYEFRLRLLEAGDNAGEVETLESDPTTGCLVTKLFYTLLPDDDPRLEDAGGDPNTRINLIEDVLPLVLGLLDESIQAAINTDTVESFIGNGIELDLGPFFHDPVAPRDLLPAWDTPALEDDPDLRLVWAELECRFDTNDDDVASMRDDNYPEFAGKLAAQPYRMFDRFFCREDDASDNMVVLRNCNTDGDTICDIRHFPGYDPETDAGPTGYTALRDSMFGIAQIHRDGVQGQLPYVAFQSPSFNRLLYLDIRSTASKVFPGDIPQEIRDLDEGIGFERASQATLNAYISLLSVQVTPLLNLIP